MNRSVDGQRWRGGLIQQFVLLIFLAGLALTSFLVMGRPPRVRLEPVAGGFSQPVGLAHAGDGSGRLFVIEKGGVVRVVRDGDVAPEPFLDIRGKVSTRAERGLLGLAFDPDYDRNGAFYVNYTDEDSRTVIARYRVSGVDPDRAGPESEQVLLSVQQPTGNHNGGQLAFGPDGYLYIGLGDGGHPSSSRNGQDRATMLGKVLRIDVSGGDAGYRVPADNPFADVRGVLPEIWAYGLRNPWRFSFDRETGELYLPDLGQALYEEVSVLEAGGAGGANLGWDVMEGAHCFEADDCETEGLVMPVIEYVHGDGNAAVVGGYVYRGRAVEGLQGYYIFGDFASGRIWAAVKAGWWRTYELLDSDLVISSFGEDERGEVYVVDLVGGGVYKIAGGGW